ncbi:multidrug effflux MFS transporter [Roseibium sp.]|uniref:multidrug effflux MFS transporter n=1 Tax=Roseibium sp. TaxID=1936156 RepID=UPI003A9848DC
MSSGLFRSAVVLGLMSAVGPFSIDIYLPALPAIGEALDASVAATQMTLTVFFLSFGISQMIYGPLSDQIGRKLPVYMGLSIFCLGSLGCAFAPTIEWLIAARFVQGIGAAAVMVVPRAIIRDLHTGYEATRLMALVMLVISVSPMLAPLAGTGLIALGGWPTIFLFLAVAGLFSIAMVATTLPETLAPENRTPVNVRNLVAGSRELLKDPRFMGLTLIGGCGLASFFVFIASASFVYTQQYGLSLMQFSLAFAVNAIGFFSSSQFAAGLGERFGMARMIAWATTGFFLIELALLTLTAAGLGSLPVLIAFLFAGNACLGLVIPTTMVLALDRHGHIAGLASSLGGTLQMVIGGLMIAAASPFFDGTALPMVATIAVCAVMAFAISRILRVGAPETRGTV